jgi:hypothetical protein
MNKNLKSEIQTKLEKMTTQTLALHFEEKGRFNVYLMAKKIDGRILWQIQEIVSTRGWWIVWDGLFEDVENALVVIEQTCKTKIVRESIYA